MLNRHEHTNNHLQNAWDKYGEENFRFEILEQCEIRDLNRREKYWIDYYNSNDNQNGYNLRIDPFSNRGLKWTEHQRKVMEEKCNDPDGWYKNHSIPIETQEKAWTANRNRIWTDEDRKRQSEILTGTKVQDTTNMKAAQKGENNNGAKLTQCDVEEIIYLLHIGYKQQYLADAYGVSRSNISFIKHQQSWRFLSREQIINDAIIKERAINYIQNLYKSNEKVVLREA